MNFIRSVERLQLLNDLILQNRTGSPEELAKRLGVSRSYLYVMIDELKALNIHIAYSRKKKTFFYEKGVNLELVFKVQALTEDDLKNFNAGAFTFPFPSSILDGRHLSLSSYLREYKELYHRL
jgi:biotin operon repressor